MTLNAEHLPDDIATTLEILPRDKAISRSRDGDVSFTDLVVHAAAVSPDGVLSVTGTVVAISPRYAEIMDEVAEANMQVMFDSGVREVADDYIYELLRLIDEDSKQELHVSETTVRAEFASLLSAGLFARAHSVSAVDVSELDVIEEALIAGSDNRYELHETLQPLLDALWEERDSGLGFDSDGIHEDTGTEFGPDGYSRDGVSERGWRRDGTHVATGPTVSPEGLPYEYDAALHSK